MPARLLRGDDPNDGHTAPRVSHPVNLCLNAAKRYEPDLAIACTVIDPFDDFIGKNRCGGEKRDTVLGDVLRRLVRVPLELQLVHSLPMPQLIHDCVHKAND